MLSVLFNLLHAFVSFSPFKRVTYSIAFYLLIITTILIDFPLNNFKFSSTYFVNRHHVSSFTSIYKFLLFFD